jgi:hypothetical protein
MHRLVESRGQPGWVAALTPFSVDGMIVAASTTLLADSRTGRRGGLSPWTLLAADSVASLAANVAVAEPTPICRVIAAWPSFVLTASYELLTARSAAALPNSAPTADGRGSPGHQHRRPPNLHPPLRLVRPPELGRGNRGPSAPCGQSGDRRALVGAAGASGYRSNDHQNDAYGDRDVPAGVMVDLPMGGMAREERGECVDGLDHVDDAHDHGQDAEHDQNDPDQRRHPGPPSMGGLRLGGGWRGWGKRAGKFGYGLTANGGATGQASFVDA